MMNLSFDIERLRNLMGKTTNIRNISLFANEEQRCALKETMISKAGVVYHRLPSRYTNNWERNYHCCPLHEDCPCEGHTENLPETEHRCCRLNELWRDCEELPRPTMKPTGFAMAFELKKELISDIQQRTESNEFLINWIDSSQDCSEISDVLSVIDGAVVVIDPVEGVSVQTETVLRQFLTRRIKPVLVFDNVDLQLQHGKEALYCSFLGAIKSFNGIILSNVDEALGDWRVSPDLGNVAFGSCIQGWVFTVSQFAQRYAKKFGVDRAKMMLRLWGDNYFNPSTKKWTTNRTTDDGKQLERSFNMFVLDPIYKLFDSILNDRVEVYNAMISKLNLELSTVEKELRVMELLKAVMCRFLPATDTFLEMISIHLPSPSAAQNYRYDILYDGPVKDECALGIKNCDPDGPLMLGISRMIPTSDKRLFYALGRVFSGTLSGGQKVRIQGPHYEPGKKDDVSLKTIQRVCVMLGRVAQEVEDCPAGSVICLIGVDRFLVKTGTVTDCETAQNLNLMESSLIDLRDNL